MRARAKAGSSANLRGTTLRLTVSSIKLRYYLIRDSLAWGRRRRRSDRASARGGLKAMPKKVMIVEDNELNMKLFRDLIEASGYETVRTRNGLEALDLARAHRPDLILMDIQLPEVSGPRSHQMAEGGRRSAQDPGDRGHRLRHEGRRGAHPPGRLRGLHFQADLGAALHRDHQILSRRRMMRATSRSTQETMTARILVVDDIPANVKLLEVRLLAEYFEVLTATKRRRGDRDLRERQGRRRAARRDDAGHGRLRGLPPAEGRSGDRRIFRSS